jgi:hypothetical protein
LRNDRQTRLGQRSEGTACAHNLKLINMLAGAFTTRIQPSPGVATELFDHCLVWLIDLTWCWKRCSEVSLAKTPDSSIIAAWEFQFVANNVRERHESSALKRCWTQIFVYKPVSSIN